MKHLKVALIAIKCFIKTSIEVYVISVEYKIAVLELDQFWFPESSLRYQADALAISIHRFKLSILGTLP